jgi:hypothetical protein
MTEEEKDIRIMELEEFLESIIDNVYYYDSPIYREAVKLLNKH